MESQDHDQLRQEQKEQEDRELYQEDMENAEVEICEAFCNSNKLGIEVEDLIGIIKKAFYEAEDIKINIERLDKRLDGLPFEKQIEIIEKEFTK